MASGGADHDERILTGAGAYFRGVVEASSDCVRVLSASGEVEYMNARGQALFEIDDFERNRGRYWPSQWPPESRAEVERALQAAREGTTSTFRAFCPTARGAPRAWETTVAPIRDGEGNISRLLATSRDITRELEADEHRRLLVNELNHRVKNTLTIVQSVAAQSLRRAGVDRRVRDDLEDRIMAIAATHGVLTEESWQAVGLRDIVRGSVTPYCTAPGQLDVAGDDIRVAPKPAITFALGLHELAINALRYGSLSAGGRVVLTCEADRPADRLSLSWAESGGPAVQPPVRRGFGSRILEQALAAEVRGAVALQFRPEGLRCEVTGVLSAVEA